MEPRDLKVGEKYFWFGYNQIDILQYDKECETSEKYYEFLSWQFTVIASTSKYESFGVETNLDLDAVKVTLPYDNLWQFCNLFFDFRRGDKRYRLKHYDTLRSRKG